MIFFLYGILNDDPFFAKQVEQTFVELKNAGYSIPANDKSAYPLRIYPLNGKNKQLQGNLSHYGGLWKPGFISIQTNPLPQYTTQMFLRHELVHEMNFQNCKNFPLWADEASALAFSGELNAFSDEEINENKKYELKESIVKGKKLTKENIASLAYYLKKYGWKSSPCKIPKEYDFLKEQIPEGALSWRVISLVSGRVLETGGDQNSPVPLGSLLKIPFVASLKAKNNAKNDELGQALLESNTRKIIKISHLNYNFDKNAYLNLMNPFLNKIEQADLEKKVKFNDEELLGMRKQNGDFFAPLSLKKAAFLMRSAFLLGGQDKFLILKKNGLVPDSTLYLASFAVKEKLKNMNVISKTGTIASVNGNPIAGHVLYIWPSSNPQYLAIVRQSNVNGYSAASHSLNLLSKWEKNYRKNDIVKVHVFSKVKTDVSFSSECGLLKTDWYGQESYFSPCGLISLIANHPYLKKNSRNIWGVVKPKAQIAYVDLNSYVEGVVQSEADFLHGEALSAFKAVVEWNALYSSKKDPICDTTRCMVYLGNENNILGQSTIFDRNYNDELVFYLNQFKNHEKWFSFSNGGTQDWHSEISVFQMNKIFKTDLVLNINRMRTRDNVNIEMTYFDGHETLSCEVFRNSLKLFSCPQKISFHKTKNSWEFWGQGEGHGKGLNLLNVEQLSKDGFTAKEILKKYYEKF